MNKMIFKRDPSDAFVPARKQPRKDFQSMLTERMRKFGYEGIKKKKASGMTEWEAYMFHIGIRRGSEKSIARRLKKGGFKLFYDPCDAGWNTNCKLDEVEATPILVPELLWTKVMALGYLP